MNRSIANLLSFVLGIFCTFACAAEPPLFDESIQPRTWSFPRDHGRHDGFKLEWWYFTGHLRDPSGHRFGYQITFFRSAFRAKSTDRQSPWAMTDLYFAHAAISDIDGKAFVFKDRLQRARPGLAFASDQTMDVALLDWFAKRDDTTGRISLRASEPDLMIDLTCAAGRGPILQGPGGVNAKGRDVGQASYYYSMTRLPTAGAITFRGQTFQVTGQSWMDHEFSSNALGDNQVGWDWMGLHLANGDDLMVYRLRNKSGAVDYLSGTRITPDGQPHYLSDRDLTIEPSDNWKSPTSGGSYPQRWTIRCAGLPTLVVRSQMPGQELITSGSTDVTYFEGAAEVLDDHDKFAGEGYLEMTGYVRN
jgi:predicted secreted hydrolase